MVHQVDNNEQYPYIPVFFDNIQQPVCITMVTPSLKVFGISSSSMFQYYSGYRLSQWETTLQCNVVSQWLSPYPEWSPVFIRRWFRNWKISYTSFCRLMSRYLQGPGYTRWPTQDLPIWIFCLILFKKLCSASGWSSARYQLTSWINVTLSSLRPSETNNISLNLYTKPFLIAKHVSRITRGFPM